MDTLSVASNQVLDKSTPEKQIAAWIDEIGQSTNLRNSLVELLPERNPIYLDRSTNETTRIRGYVLAAFEQTGLPDAAVPYVLDELQNGRDAYVVAGAAKAIRGISVPTSQIIPFLFEAIENIKYVDDALTFESYRPTWPNTNYTTALREIFVTFQWLGSVAQDALPGLEALYEDQTDFSARIRAEIKNAIDSIQASGNAAEAGCCSIPVDLISSVERCHDAYGDAESVADIEFEDQDGKSIKYSEIFSQKPSIVVFFYSRCNNPNKCSLTITKLARLQKIIREQGLESQLKTAAITYDPEYDLPARLRAYCENRGMSFGDNDRALRTRTGFKKLQEHFRLGVNFNNSIVNRHRIELFILDESGAIAFASTRMQWDIHDVLNKAKSLLNPNDTSSLAKLRRVDISQNIGIDSEGEHLQDSCDCCAG